MKCWAKPGTMARRVLDALADGPATSGEIQAETGLPRGYASALLGRALKRGLVTRSPKPIKFSSDVAGAPAYLYELRPTT